MRRAHTASATSLGDLFSVSMRRSNSADAWAAQAAAACAYSHRPSSLAGDSPRRARRFRKIDWDAMRHTCTTRHRRRVNASRKTPHSSRSSVFGTINGSARRPNNSAPATVRRRHRSGFGDPVGAVEQHYRPPWEGGDTHDAARNARRPRVCANRLKCPRDDGIRPGRAWKP